MQQNVSQEYLESAREKIFKNVSNLFQNTYRTKDEIEYDFYVRENSFDDIVCFSYNGDEVRYIPDKRNGGFIKEQDRVDHRSSQGADEIFFHSVYDKDGNLEEFIDCSILHQEDPQRVISKIERHEVYEKQWNRLLNNENSSVHKAVSAKKGSDVYVQYGNDGGVRIIRAEEILSDRIADFPFSVKYEMEYSPEVVSKYGKDVARKKAESLAERLESKKYKNEGHCLNQEDNAR